MKTLPLPGLLLRLATPVLLLCFALQTHGYVYFVTDTNDSTQVTSLRGAVIAANNSGGHSVIVLGHEQPQRGHHSQPHQWTYHLTIPGAKEDAAFTGDLDITRGKLEIVGVGADVIIDATGLGDRIFQVFSNVQLKLENITLQGGSASGGGDGSSNGEAGGAICNAGDLVLQCCIITHNTSGAGNFLQGNGGGTGGGDAGGVFNSGVLQAESCIIAENGCGAGFDGLYGGSGGGIKNDGRCYLIGCMIRGNQSGAGAGPIGNEGGWGGSGGNGGGICNYGTLVLDQCIVRENFAGEGADGGDPGWSGATTPGGWGGGGGNGGGIYNAGRMQIMCSAICGNHGGNGGDGDSFGSGGSPGAGGNGGGVFNEGHLSLDTCTVSGNSCGSGGAGGSGLNSVGASGGTGGNGGGVCNLGSLDVASSTVVLNQTGAGGNAGDGIGSFFPPSNSAASGGQGGDGGGLFNSPTATAVALRNTLIALNLVNTGGAGGTVVGGGVIIIDSPPPSPTVGAAGRDGIGPDAAGAFGSGGFNLIGIADGSTGFVHQINADQVGGSAAPINPLIGPLQMNGDFIPTHALLPGSPAIDQGNSFGMHYDQRGERRPYDWPRILNAPGGNGSDIGAFELHSSGSGDRHAWGHGRTPSETSKARICEE